MNKLLLALAILFSFVSLKAQSKEYQEKIKASQKRAEWFRDARFGMFIHWGAYSVPARGEWVQSNEKISKEDYKEYVEVFKPQNYKPKEWAKLAKEAGMKYAVMTTKHHDGYCLFDSKLTDYKIGTYMKDRDFIKEYVDAFRAEGLKVGFYYSIIDWNHPDYPGVGNHPLADDKEYNKQKFDWDNYLDYMHGQIEELMTNYGKIDIIWVDYSFEGYEDEKWRASDLIKMIRKHQPDILINNRLVNHVGFLGKGEKEFSGYGDFETPEQGIPDGDIKDKYGNSIPWEACLTLNNNWGYHLNDHDWKTPKMVVNTLVNCVSKNGNLLLNVGPDAGGTIPIQSREILKEVGKWMKQNSESIYGNVDAGIEKPEWGYYTKKGKDIYAHWTNPIIGHINVNGIGKEIKSATTLNTGLKAFTTKTWWGNLDEGNIFMNIKEPTYMTFKLPSNIDTVFKIQTK